VLQKADGLHEHEVGAQLPGIKPVGHRSTLHAANSKHWEHRHLLRTCCFEVEADIVDPYASTSKQKRQHHEESS
jgi:hypothetical protein